jgi:hypothetical protein
LVRLLRESDNPDVAFRDLLEALRSAGVEVLGAEITNELFSDAGREPSAS